MADDRINAVGTSIAEIATMIRNVEERGGYASVMIQKH